MDRNLAIAIECLYFLLALGCIVKLTCEYCVYFLSYLYLIVTFHFSFFARCRKKPNLKTKTNLFLRMIVKKVTCITKIVK